MANQFHRDAYLSTAPSTNKDRKFAFYAVVASLFLFACAAPFVRVSFPPVPAFVASYHASLTVVYVVTAILLYTQFAVLRSRSILILASGYLLTAMVIACYALTYTDLFATSGLFYPGDETTVWFYLVWHGVLPIFTIPYALSRSDRPDYRSRRAARAALSWSIAGVIFAAMFVLATLTVGHDYLPDLIDNSTFTFPMKSIVSGIFAACLLAILLLLRRKPYSVLDVWLMVILCAWIFDVSLSAVLNAARFDFGFYAGRIYGLSAAVGILGILLAEMAGIQLRLSYIMGQQNREAARKLEEYAERERLFSAAMRSSNDAIITKSLDGTITGWNKAAEHLFGFTAGEVLGRSINLIVPEDRRSEIQQILIDVRDGKTIESHETVRVAKDGRLIDIALSVSPVRSDTGQTIGAAKVARDITEQKLSAEKFRLAVDASPNGLIMIDSTGRMILVNTETERLFGYNRRELLGERVDMLLPTELREAHASLRHGFNGRPTSRPMGAGMELMGQRKDGDRFPLEIGLNPVSTRAGTLVLAVVVDISARKKAERALRESERMAQRILDTALDGFVQFNSALRVTDVNRQAEIILEYTREEMLCRPVLELLFPMEDAREEPNDLSEFLAGKRPGPPGGRFEISTNRRTGQATVLELSLTHYHRDGEKLYNAFLRDLTEQRAAEASSRQMQKMEAIGQLTGGVAHDFNNILTVITGTIEILCQGVEDRPQLAAIAKLIDSAANRGADLTKHLLAFSRSQPLRPRDVDVNHLVIEAAKLLRPTLGAQIEISVDASSDAWPALVDPSQLTNAVLNLALNARDASSPGGAITLRTSNVSALDTIAWQDDGLPPADYVVVEVIDNGHGMDIATLRRVFEPFFTTKGVGQGTGLGLSMVYGFAKQSNGHVAIKSELGKGTSVYLFLPKADPFDKHVAKEIEDSLILGGDETILIVEDDALVREFVTTQIQSLGYKTLCAVDGASALKLLDSTETIDLLFTDIVLPGAMNGRQIAAGAASLRPDLPVLFTSGYTEDPDIRDSLLEGEILLLAKPYRLAELALSIRRAMTTGAMRF